MAHAICGIYHRGEADADAVEAMLAALPGLGCAGRVEGDAVSFGYRGLWADAGENDAPQARCADRDLTVVADARLDNRAELADALGIAGPDKAGVQDSELILRAYERWGADCPARLHGDYAFAIWDHRERVLFCARDAVGARPFYYATGPGGRFAFASDVDAALAAPGVDGGLDETHVAAFLMHVPTDGSTFFRAVRSLPPGHSIAVGAEAERARRWWRPEDAPSVRRASDEDYEAELLDRYREAMRDRLCGAHPLGVHVSGGLDSSSVAVLAARELRPRGLRPHAFCWHPPPGDAQTEEEADEYRLIESVCEQEGLEPRYHSVSAGHTLDMLRRDVTRFPDRDGTLLHESLVQRSAAELGVRVILSGWGGDDCVSCAGTGYYAELLRGGRLGRLLREARAVSDRPWRFVARHAVLSQLRLPPTSVAAALLRGRMPRAHISMAHPALSRRHRRRRPGLPRLNGVRRTQLERLGSPFLVPRIEDWAASGARAGIEYRYPLLDRRLIEFVLGLPVEQFRHGARSRWLMRRSLRSVLPPAVLEGSNKRDPARARPTMAALDEALPAISRQLAARSAPPARAAYLDMDKLRAHMEAGVFPRKRTHPGKLSRALKLLDWQTD